jgi:hypothetical protein
MPCFQRCGSTNRASNSAPRRAQYHSGKAGDDTVAFCDEDATGCNLLDRQSDRVGVREERLAIPGIAERRTPLQRLEHCLIVGPCRADGNTLCH